ncbi:MAG: citrate/2-methylcitrate synthase [Hyphomicrobiaceae bacterium]
MATRTMGDWQTSICQVINEKGNDQIIVRGHDLNELIDDLSFAGMMFLMLKGELPTKNQTRVLDALLVASVEHGIAPPSMVARCFASYGTTIQQAVGSGIMAFGDRMGGLGEQMARMMTEALADQPRDRQVEDIVLRDKAAAIVATCRNAGERVPGYGIPLHGEDPRAPKVLGIAREYGVYGVYCRFAEIIGEELAKSRGSRPIPMNLDGVGACVVLDLGFSWQATRLFLLTPRSVSMGAHYLEEKAQDSTWRHIPADQIEYVE